MKRTAILVVLLLAAASAWPQALYKWTDKDGKVQYADKPPLRFEGPVTKIEIDVPADPEIGRAHV